MFPNIFISRYKRPRSYRSPDLSLNYHLISIINIQLHLSAEGRRDGRESQVSVYWQQLRTNQHSATNTWCHCSCEDTCPVFNTVWVTWGHSQPDHQYTWLMLTISWRIHHIHLRRVRAHTDQYQQLHHQTGSMLTISWSAVTMVTTAHTGFGHSLKCKSNIFTTLNICSIWLWNCKIKPK